MNLQFSTNGFLATAVLFLLSCSPKEQPMQEVIAKGMDMALKQSLLMAESLKDSTDRLPRTTDYNGRIVTSDSRWWCSGFFPGVLWYVYDYSHNEQAKMWAERYTLRIEREKLTTDNHDVGFMIHCSFGNGYRLTGNNAYIGVIDTACLSLCTRYREQPGLIRSWNFNADRWNYPVIIDNMMNLEILMWASKKTGNKHYRTVAINHADLTMKHHFRNDYSSYHVVSYDTLTGEPHLKATHQGYADHSAWARGQAWGLYGYSMMYRETGKERYLKMAQHIADYLINHPNMPSDGIPYWDLNAPNIPDAYRDASAGAVICSALIELSQAADNGKSKTYLDLAEKQLRTLSSPSYLAEPGTNGYFILKHSVGYLAKNSEVDLPLTYADYYYVEALVRYNALIGGTLRK